MSRARTIADYGDGVAASDLASTLDLSGKTVTLPSGTGGKVLQMVQTNQGHKYINQTSWMDTGLAGTITSTQANSKFYVLFTFCSQTEQNGTEAVMEIRSSLDSYTARVGGAGVSGTIRSSSGWVQLPGSLQVLDSPSQPAGTTITYTIYGKRTAGTSTFYLADIWGGESKATAAMIMELAG